LAQVPPIKLVDFGRGQQQEEQSALVARKRTGSASNEPWLNSKLC